MRRRLALDVAAAAARHAVGVIVGVVSVGLVARRLGPTGLGAWSLLGSVGFLVGLCELGLSVGVGRAQASGDEHAVRRAVELALWVIWRLGPVLGAAAIAWALGELRASGFDARSLGLTGALVLLGGVAGSLAMPLRSALIVRGRLGPMSAARSVGGVAQLLALGVGFALVPGLAVPAAAFALGAVAELVLLGREARRSLRGLRWWPGTGASSGLPAALGQGAASLGINVAVALSLRLDAALLVAIAPLGAIAAYGVAARAVDQAFGLIKQAGVALQPRMASRQDRAGALEVGVTLIPPLVVAAMAALWFSGEPLLRLWVGNAIEDGAFRTALGLLGAAAIAAAFSEVSNSLLVLAAPSPWQSTAAVVSGCAVNLLVSIVGRSYGGVAAVAAGTLAGNLVSAGIAWVLAARLVRWSPITVARSWAPTAAAVVAAAALGPTSARLASLHLPGALAGCSLVGSGALVAALVVTLLTRRPRSPEAACTSAS